MEKFNLYPFQYFPRYYNKNGLFEELKKIITFQQDKIIIGEENKERIERRKTSWLSNNNNLTFEYSGKVMKPNNIPTVLYDLIDLIKKDFGILFDGILVNYYENGQVGMGYHSDPIDDKWDNNFVILSLGAERKLIFREKENKEHKKEFMFNNGDLIYMFGNCQEKYEHSVRKNKDNSDRISLVFKKNKI